MSLVRAFTTRRKQIEEITNVHIGRAASHRVGRPVNRALISSPVELLSTTNPLSYEAPSIAGTMPIQCRNAAPSSSSSSPRHSSEESDASTLSINSSTDASSVDESPVSPEPEPNHLSCYFKPAVDTSIKRSPSLSGRLSSCDAPQIPRRVPSHSKKAHEQLHRKRSVQRMISPPSSIAHNSAEITTQLIDTPMESPFGNELAQLEEVQEELSHTVRDAERDYMDAHGLAHFDASDYLTEIHSILYDVYLADEPSWI